MMKPEAQQIAIAEACGWKWEARIKGSIKVWNKPPLMVFYDSELPNYLNDLNAMHEAEKVLNQEQKEDYFFIIFNFYGNWPKAIQATADQRARAFLRVIEKWEGE
jgi:hypothetical protein